MECKNCGRDFLENFCPNCGQRKMSNNKLKLFELIGKFIDDEFDLHRGFFHTLWQLSYKPGTVARNYVQGKRKRYTAPTRFLIITLAFQALIDFLSEAKYLIREYDFSYLPLISARLHDDMQYYNYIFGTEWALSVNIVQLAIFPFAFNLFFRKRDYNYTEILVVSFYFISIALIFNILLSFILRHVFGLYLSGEFVSIFMLGVLTWAYYRFYIDYKPVFRLLKVIASLLLIIIIRVYLAPLVFAVLFPVQSDLVLNH